jgi:hypothetical protein
MNYTYEARHPRNPADSDRKRFVYNWKHKASGTLGMSTIYLWSRDDLVKLVAEWNRLDSGWEYSLQN